MIYSSIEYFAPDVIHHGHKVDGFVKSPNSVLRCILRFFKVR